MVKIALVSDIHGNLPALEAVVADIRRRGVDQIVNLGDSLSGPLLPLETARYLIAAGWPTLAGNHERQVLNLDSTRCSASDAFARRCLSEPELDWLRGLPGTLRLTPEVLLCHGTPTNDLQYFLETVEPDQLRLASEAEISQRLAGETAPVVACGHTHLPRALRNRRGQLLVNPGSVGCPAYDDDHPWPHKVENGSPDARYAILSSDGGAWRVDLLAVPYDHASMAALAGQRGQRDWQHALLTGYVI